MPLALDLLGLRIGRLVALERYGNDRHGNTKWRCQCDCGNQAIVLTASLRSGNTKSCGCLGKELRMTGRNNLIHGASGSPEFSVWRAMHERCEYRKNVSYRRYGARGIKVCARWHGRDGFQNFLADMGARPSLEHSIDRIDNDGDYAPNNCRWATRREQAQNTRQSRRLEYLGRVQTISDWARELNVNHRTVRGRLQLGWSAEKALRGPTPDERHASYVERGRSRRLAAKREQKK